MADYDPREDAFDADIERSPEQEAEARADIRPLAQAFRLQGRSRSAARAAAIVRRMRLPFAPQIAAMGDLYETAETGRLLKGQKQVGCLSATSTRTWQTAPSPIERPSRSAANRSAP